MSLEKFEGLLLICAIVAMLARRVGLPYTVGLVMTGIALAFSPIASGASLTRDLLFGALLPPLVFEGALHIPWRELRRDLPVVLLLATIGVALSAAITACGLRYLAHWEWSAAILFGVLIAATDPVSVIASFKEAGLGGRLKLIVESESLINDGTAAVGFALVLSSLHGSAPTLAGTVFASIQMVLGSLAIGAVISLLVLWLAGNTDEHLIEMTFTTVAAYGSFLVAEHLHLSGVLATLTCGMIIGNVGHLGSITDEGREGVISFWEFAAFVANSLVFLLLGMSEARIQFSRLLIVCMLAIVLVLVGRAAAVYGCSVVFCRSSLRVAPLHQHILVWGGLRGALALALALGLPAEIPRRTEIVTVAFAVVAFSVIVQGLTIHPVLLRMKASDEAGPTESVAQG